MVAMEGRSIIDEGVYILLLGIYGRKMSYLFCQKIRPSEANEEKKDHIGNASKMKKLKK